MVSISVLTVISNTFSQSAKSMSAGHWEVEPTLNHKLPHLRALTVEEFLRKYWEGADWSTPAAAA